MIPIEKLVKTAVLGGAVGLMTIMGGVGDAEAGKKRGLSKHKSIHFHVHKVHRPRVFIRSYDYGCGYYKFKWHQTGRYYWKSKYFHCIGY